MMSDQVREQIRAELDEIRVIDSHEHTESAEFARSCENHLFRILSRSLVQHDLARTGVIQQKWKAAEQDDQEGWPALKRHIDVCRNTGYFRCFLFAVRDLLELPIEELTDGNWQVVSDALEAANRREDWYAHVLRERARIDLVLWDHVAGDPEWADIDDRLFAPVARFDRWAIIEAGGYRQALAHEFGAEPTTLGDLVDGMDAGFRRAVEDGIAGVKIGAAYFRRIGFDECPRREASRIFSTPSASLTRTEVLTYQDFVFSEIIRKCVASDLPILIHTGMQSRQGFIHNGYPPYLESTVARHPRAKFVLLHGAYPFTSHAASLAARYPNVYVDGSWLPVLSPGAYRRALSEWLDVLPVERILAWGGDAIRVEMTYGSLVMAKDIVADVLAERTRNGRLSERGAVDVAARIFRENLRDLFQTDLVRTKRLKRLEHAGKKAA